MSPRVFRHWRSLVFFAGLTAASLLATPARAASDMFLRITTVTGESTDAAHGGDMDIQAFGWSVSNNSKPSLGGGATVGTATANTVYVTKFVDKGSIKLMTGVFASSHFTQAILFVRKAGSNPVEYLKVTLDDVVVSSYSPAGTIGEDRITEQISLSFAKIKFDYVPVNADGSVGATVTGGWNLLSNVKI